MRYTLQWRTSNYSACMQCVCVVCLKILLITKYFVSSYMRVFCIIVMKFIMFLLHDTGALCTCLHMPELVMKNLDP